MNKYRWWFLIVIGVVSIIIPLSINVFTPSGLDLLSYVGGMIFMCICWIFSNYIQLKEKQDKGL